MNFLLLIIIVIVVIVLFIFTFIIPIIIYWLSLTPILGYVGIIANSISMMINSIMPVQPLTAKIIGYSVVICHSDPNNWSYSSCMTPRATIIGNNSFALHVGDRFTLEALIYNPNWFSIHTYSTSISFDRNAVYHHYMGCAGSTMDIALNSHEFTEIRIPNNDCQVGITNSTGISNATVKIQYQIDQKTYYINASKTFTILP